MKVIFMVLAVSIAIGGHLKAQQMNGKYVEYAGGRNYYQIYGAGEKVLLIINGGPGMNSQGFGSLASQLAKRYGIRAITYDQRGTGKSTCKDANAVTLRRMLNDIEDIRIAENINEWIVFGQSFGGMLASYYTSEYPDKVSKLILSSSGGLSVDDLNDVDIFGQLTLAELDSFNYWNLKVQNSNNPDDLYKRNTFLASAYLVRDDYIQQIASRLGEVDLEINRIVFQDLSRTGFDCSLKLKSFKKPSLIFVGEHDVVSKSAVQKTHQILSNSELVIIPNSGHYGWLDNPDVYFGALDRFMSAGVIGDP